MMGVTEEIMEWLSFHIDGELNTIAEVKRRRERRIEGKTEKIVKALSRNNVVYAAVRIKEREKEIIQGEVFVFSKCTDYENISYCHYTENENPEYWKCPKSILKLLSDTQNERAVLWRKRCQEYIIKQKDPLSLNNLPLHTKIQLETEESKILEKIFFKNLKRPVWIDWKRWEKYDEKDIERIGYQILP